MIRLFLVLICFWANSAISADSSNLIKLIENEDWKNAKKAAPQYSSLLSWLEFNNETNPNFYDLKKFIEQHPNWPQISNLKRKIEESNFKDCKNSDLKAWFEKHPPKTISGKKKYLSLIEDEKLKAKYVSEVWIEANFTKADEEEFIKKYNKFLTKETYISRVNNFLFNNKTEQASRALSYIPKDMASTYKTRIEIQKGDLANPRTSKMLGMTHNSTLPSTTDVGILYDIATMYNKIDDEDNLLKILKTSAKIKSPYQHYFWNMKVKLIRDLIKDKDYKTAYLFASSHGDLGKSEYSEAEWLSGWISLRYLNDPKLAITHFTNMYNKVKRPMSVSRASYWLARSYELIGDDINSKLWYKEAGKYFTSFYGQLAICKTDDCQVNIPKDPLITELDRKQFDKNIIVNSAMILYKTKKYKHLVQPFLLQAIDNSENLAEISLITKLGMDLNHQHLSVEAAKHASYKDVLIIHSNYPILKSVYKDHSLDPALVMALIRQESVFNHKAVSSAGAMGLMQLMPHVAKETSKHLNLQYRKEKLSDPHFNTHLGTSHLDKLVTCYNPSYILSIAAYNAGDKPVLKWIEKNGDPREMDNIEDIVDWIERISFYETRNYVQRVLESKSIYHLLMTKQTKLPILSDLTTGSGESCAVTLE